MKKAVLIFALIVGCTTFGACGGNAGSGNSCGAEGCGGQQVATHFSVSAPSNATANTSFTFMVTAQDASNSTVTTYSGTVHFSSSDNLATLPANSTLTNGVGTFSATLQTPGSQTISATDTVTASITGISSSISVAGPATHLSVSAPASATHGVAFNYTVTALDVANNTVSTYSGTVQFTSSDPQALLPATSMLPNGSASFSATLNTTGSQTITAMDISKASINGTSNVIQVSTATALSITSGSLPDGTVGDKYDLRCSQIPPCNVFVSGFPLSASGGMPPDAWSASGLPPGLALVTTSGSASACLNVSLPAICGTPTAPGSYDVTLSVTDSESPAASSSAKYAVDIKEAGTNAVPFLNQPLLPDAALPGGAGFTLSLRGTGFVPGSVVDWNGSPRASTFISQSELSAAIPPSDVAAANTASVTVVNPASGGGTSNAVFFEATEPTSWVALGSPTQLTVGSGFFSIALGDFNGDGKLDLAVVNTNFNNGSVFLGNGNGSFKPAGTFSVGSSPSSIVAGDFNGDGKVDLAVANNGSNNVSVLLGNGDGTFQSAVNYDVDQNPTSVVIGDFNGDGALDLAVTNIGSNDVSVLLGNGDGTFQPAVNYGVGQNPAFIAVGDFNGDGNLDLVATNNLSGNVSILFGIGNGAFLPAVNYDAGQNPGSIVVGDFNGDGNLDLAVADSLGNSVSVLLGNGDGSFQAPVSYAAGFEPSLALADLNGDGKLDLAVGDIGSSEVTVLLGNGDGTFEPTVSYGVAQGVGGVALGDFTGAGKLELAVPGTSSVLTVFPQSAPLSGANATLSSTKLDFACRNVINVGCQCSTSNSFTLSNFGSQTLKISGITVTGPFSLGSNCGSSLESGRSCTVNVDWLQKQGAGAGHVTISDNAPGSPQSVTLSAVKECTPAADNEASNTNTCR